MEYTDWYPADVKPVRVGTYQFEYEHGAVFAAKWTGRKWRVNDGSLFDGDEIIPIEGDSWRGIK